MAPGKTSLLALGALLVVLLGLPLMLSPDLVGAFSKMLVWALFALAFSLLIGQAGMLSFGHAAYFAVGCFATIHAMNAVQSGLISIPTPLLPLTGAIAALLAGTLAGFFATLRSGVYFSMVTLAIAELLHTLAPNLHSVFGGEVGVSSMRQPWAGIGFGSEIEVYYLVLAWVVVSALALHLYRHTSFGRLTVALRENEKRIAFLGYNVHLTKMMVFSVSSLFAGVAGSLLALTNESANYLLFDLSYSANVVLYSFIGGVGTFLGPAIGAALMTLFGHTVSEMTRLWLLYQGLIFVLVMMYAPSGIAGFVELQVRQIARGEGWSLARRALVVIPVVMIAASTVFLCEMVATIFARDYQSQLERSGKWALVKLFRSSWAPDAVLTWAVPMAVLAGGIVLLSWLFRPGAGTALTVPSAGAQK